MQRTYLFSLRWSPSSPSVNISKTKLTLSWTYLPNHGCFLFRLPGVMSEHLGFLCLHQYPESRISIPSSFTVSSSSFLSLCLLSAPPQTCTFWPLGSLVSQLSALFQHITLDQPSWCGAAMVRRISLWTSASISVSFYLQRCISSDYNTDIIDWVAKTADIYLLEFWRLEV